MSKAQDNPNEFMVGIEEYIGEKLDWGLSVNRILDNEHKVPVIDWAEQTFTLMEEDLQTVVFSLSLDKFCTKYSQLSMV